MHDGGNGTFRFYQRGGGLTLTPYIGEYTESVCSAGLRFRILLS